MTLQRSSTVLEENTLSQYSHKPDPIESVVHFAYIAEQVLLLIQQKMSESAYLLVCKTSAPVDLKTIHTFVHIYARYARPSTTCLDLPVC